MNDKTLTSSLSQLADIELPAASSDNAALTWSILIGAVFAGVIAYVVWRKRYARRARTINTAQDALVQLARIQQQWQHGQLDERQTAYRLATVLRLGLTLPQLERECPACIGQHRAQWADTIALLTALRYRYDDSAAKLNPAIFDLIGQWLRGAR